MYVVWPTNLAVGASCARDLSTHQLWRDKALESFSSPLGGIFECSKTSCRSTLRIATSSTKTTKNRKLNDSVNAISVVQSGKLSDKNDEDC